MQIALIVDMPSLSVEFSDAAGFSAGGPPASVITVSPRAWPIDRPRRPMIVRIAVLGAMIDLIDDVNGGLLVDIKCDVGVPLEIFAWQHGQLVLAAELLPLGPQQLRMRG